MKRTLAIIVAALCAVCNVRAVTAPLIYEGSIDFQGKPMAHRNGRAQWDIPSKVGNTGRVKLYTYSGDSVYDTTPFTATFHAGPSVDEANVIEVACTTNATYIEFTFATDDLAYPFEDWYSSIKLTSGSTIVSQPEGHLSCSGAPEVSGGTVSFNYYRNWALWLGGYSNAGSGPGIGDLTTITWSTNANGQAVFAAVNTGDITAVLGTAPIVVTGGATGDATVTFVGSTRWTSRSTSVAG